MPVYEFLCDHCGPFEQHRDFSQAGVPLDCPTCRVPARRLFSAPGLFRLPTALRQRIDQSAQPRVEQRLVQPAGHDAGHHHGRPWQAGH